MKEIRLSEHARLKLETLANHELTINLAFIIETLQFPDKVEALPSNKLVAQKRLNENLALCVGFREFSSFIFVIT